MRETENTLVNVGADEPKFPPAGGLKEASREKKRRSTVARCSVASFENSLFLDTLF